MRILVTDANGFVGRALCSEALARGAAVRGITRAPCDLPIGVANVVVGSIDGSTDWLDVLADCEVVVHLAARVHVMADTDADPLDKFRRVNVQGTLNLARQAASVGVQRFVFVSSIKVNGEASQLGHPFTADDAPAPLDAYGVSKMEAEQGLREIARQTGMELVIIRPPLVYGPGVKANFAAMMRWLKRGVPLPLGAIYNQRSLVLSREEMACAEDLGDYFRVPPDGRDLNYAKFVEQGKQRLTQSSHAEEYHSHNTTRLDLAGMKALLLKLDFMQRIARGEHVVAEE